MFVIMVYDINAKRVAKVLKTSRRYLVWVQESVFEGDMTPGRLKSLKNELNKIINPEEDSVLFYVWKVGHYTFRDQIGTNRASWEDMNIL